MNDTPWIKARASGNNGGNCVEVRRHDGQVEVRDTKDRTGPILHFTPAAWAAFVTTAKHSTLDLP